MGESNDTLKFLFNIFVNVLPLSFNRADEEILVGLSAVFANAQTLSAIIRSGTIDSAS